VFDYVLRNHFIIFILFSSVSAPK